jgi:hypothetical protein
MRWRVRLVFQSCVFLAWMFLLNISSDWQWSRIVGKLAVIQLIRSSLCLTELWSFFCCLREPVTGPCPEAGGSNPHTLIPFLKIGSNIVLPFMPGTSPAACFLQVFPPKTLYELIFHGFQLPAYLIIRDFITIIIFCENCKLWTTSLCGFFHPPITAALADPNIYSQNPPSPPFFCRFW